MILQNLILPKAGMCTEEQLYFRKNENVSYVFAKDVIDFKKGGLIEFDTYFNGFSAEKFFKYTTIQDVSINLKLRGDFIVTLLRKEKQGPRIITEFISEKIVSASEEEEFNFPFTYKNTNGMFCFKLFCLTDNGSLFGGSYTSNVDEQKLRNIKIGIDICTFKREKFVEKNMESLKSAFFNNKSSALYGKLEVFISDNAKSLPDYIDDKKHIHVFKNKNVGGAGGFTRGLIEITKNGNPHGITHALIMDDDIIFDPEVVFRTWVILSLVKPQYEDVFVGGAMLRLDDQSIQVESGAVWNKGQIVSLKSGLNLNSLDAVLYNETEESVDYNAWWYCVVPIQTVREDNLPLPIFIRGDDVEYGLRNIKKLILMNGICVWHEPFENKYSSSMYYYIFRNRLIDNSVRGIVWKKKDFKKELKGWIKNEVRCMRYDNASLLIEGVNDFLKGIDWLKSQDGEALHKEILSKSYKFKYIDDLDFPFSYYMYDQTMASMNWAGKKVKFKNLIKKLTLNGLFLKPNKDVVVPAIGVQPRMLFRAKRALTYDVCSHKGFVTEKSIKRVFSLHFELSKLKRKINRNYKKITKQYFDRKNEITSLDFWNKYLMLADSKK